MESVLASPPLTESLPVALRTETPSTHVRLPKLRLKPYGGEFTKWTSFWDSFKSAVHNNRELSDMEKFNDLSTLLEHSAREPISGLSLTSENYCEPSRKDLEVSSRSLINIWMYSFTWSLSLQHRISRFCVRECRMPPSRTKISRYSLQGSILMAV